MDLRGWGSNDPEASLDFFDGRTPTVGDVQVFHIFDMFVCVFKSMILYLLAKVLDVVACLISFHKAYICKLWNFSRHFVN